MKLSTRDDKVEVGTVCLLSSHLDRSAALSKPDPLQGGRASEVEVGLAHGNSFTLCSSKVSRLLCNVLIVLSRRRWWAALCSTPSFPPPPSWGSRENTLPSNFIPTPWPKVDTKVVSILEAALKIDLTDVKEEITIPGHKIQGSAT